EGTGCDAWLLCSTTHDPLTYAAFWNRTQERERYEQALDRWVAYWRELNVHAIGLGAVILRRKAGGPVWVRTGSLPESPIDACDAQIQRVFRAEDYLASIRTDAALLAHTFVVADDH